MPDLVAYSIRSSCKKNNRKHLRFKPTAAQNIKVRLAEGQKYGLGIISKKLSVVNALGRGLCSVFIAKLTSKHAP
jgi:hypothetical protein